MGWSGWSDEDECAECIYGKDAHNNVNACGQFKSVASLVRERLGLAASLIKRHNWSKHGNLLSGITMTGAINEASRGLRGLVLDRMRNRVRMVLSLDFGIVSSITEFNEEICQDKQTAIDLLTHAARWGEDRYRITQTYVDLLKTLAKAPAKFLMDSDSRTPRKEETQ